MTPKEAALEYADRGWSVIPVSGKKPLVQWQQYQTAAADAVTIANWYDGNPAAGVALVLGAVSGILRIDADGDEAVQYFLQLLKSPPVTAEFKTPSGGRGWLYAAPAFDVETEVLWKGNGRHQELRLQAGGSYTVLPPSPHPDGGCYEWVQYTAPAPLPPELKNLLRTIAAAHAVKGLVAKYADSVDLLSQPTVNEAEQLLSHIASYDDRDVWLNVGFALHSIGEELLDTWIKWSSQSTKFVAGECEKVWSDMRRDGGVTGAYLYVLAEMHGYVSPNRYLPITDMGNAAILARRYAHVLKHVSEWGWVAWDGKRWATEDAEKAATVYIQLVLGYRHAKARNSKKALEAKIQSGQGTAIDSERLKGKKRTMSLLEKHQSASHVFGACRVAASAGSLGDSSHLKDSEQKFLAITSKISTNYKLYNTQEWLLNCANGTLDLRTLAMGPHDADHMLTQLCPTRYTPDAECPRWLQFLGEIFAGDAELIAWMQRFLGLCLTGVTREHVLPVFFGGGRNGKSTLVETVCAVLGDDYACVLPSGYVVKSHGEGHPTKYVVLYGKRFAADLETDDGIKLNEPLIKRLTGGDRLVGRRMYEDFWSFKPTHKLVLATNHEPTVTGTDSAIWARLKLVPFNVSFLGREDRKLQELLNTEHEGILAWMVEGCKLWQTNGLGEPQSITTATAGYRADQDIVAHFVAEVLERDATSKLQKPIVTAAFRAWVNNRGERVVSAKAFGNAMRRLGVDGDTDHKSYCGVKLANK